MSRSEKRCDHVYAEFLHFIERMADCSRLLEAHRRSIRLNAYRAAVRYVELQQNHHNEFNRLLRSFGQDYDQLIENWFGPLRLLDEDPHALIIAIQDGLTKNEWMGQDVSARGFLDRQKRQRLAKEREQAASVTPAPTEELSIEAQCSQYKLRCTGLQELTDRLTKENRHLRTELARVQARLTSALRRVRRIERDLAPATF